MILLTKDYNELTSFEKTAIKKLKLKYGEIENYLNQALFNIEKSPKLKPCTKIIIARNPHEILGWALYTPEANTWQDLCQCKRFKNYYLQLYVSRKHRKKGIGSAIAKEAIKRSKKLKHQLVVFPHDHASSMLFSKYDNLDIHPSFKKK